ncbi:MAG TPA: MFS transporter [Polyangiales bacterium]|jgi:UMF1 family MFS transporter|nr:MFS transporter [Polyangiales bacterium]
MTSGTSRREAIAWAFYDVGNSAFTTTVMAGFFPLFFKQYWSAGANVTESTWNLGLANSLASVIVAVLAPILGAVADVGRAKKAWLAGFAALGCVATAGLFFVPQGNWPLAAAAYTLASIGFAGSLVFYDALIVSVASDEDSDRISSLGYALGYLGGGFLFALNVAMATKPSLFGLPSPSAGVRWSFITVAIWWAVFTIPLMTRVHERHTPVRAKSARPVADALKQVVVTMRRVRELRPVWMFLLAYWLYIDAVDTVIRMAVDYGLSLGLPSNSLIVALLITQFVGFPAAILFAKLASKIGTRRGILIGLVVYIGVTIFGFFMTTASEFYALAVVIGLVQGGVQALSRSYFSRLIPPEEAGEFFGFYNMLGKFAAVIGPTLMGVVGLLTGSPRFGILSLIVLLVAGGYLLMRVPEPAKSPV